MTSDEVSFDLSDQGNDLYSGSMQETRLGVHWYGDDFSEAASIYEYPTISTSNVPKSFSFAFPGGFTPQRVEIFGINQSGRMTMKVQELSAPVSTTVDCLRSGAARDSDVNSIPVIDHLLDLKQSGISRTVNRRWVWDQISKYEAKMLDKPEVDFYVQELSDTIRVTPYFKRTAPVFVKKDNSDTKPVVYLEADTSMSFQSVYFKADSSSRRNRVQSSQSEFSVETTLLSKKDKLNIKGNASHRNIGMLIDIRSDTDSLHNQLPGNLTDNKLGQDVLARTAIMLEWCDESGEVLGDYTSTTDVSEHYRYDLVYNLSEETTRMYHKLGLDTSAGSDDFYFYYADYYEAPWYVDESVDVSVDTRPDGGIDVEVAGITKDLPGALGGAPTAAGYREESPESAGSCLLERLALPRIALHHLRRGRDLLLQSAPGRWLTTVYYSLTD